MWTIILAGVQVSFAVQNVNELGPPKDVPEVEYTAHRRLALALTLAACNGDSVELTEFAQSVDVPRPWVDGVADDLIAAGILQIDGADDDVVRTARPPAEITLWDVVHSLEDREGDRELVLPPEVDARLDEAMDAVRVSLDDFGLAKP
jgi:DNA-binding IscR family transcriptional regulator